MQLERKMQENNRIKLLMLERNTLDNFVIAKDENRKDFQYCFIRGCNRNITETMNDLALRQTNILLRIQVPSQTNFMKKMREIFRNFFRREKVYFNKESHEKMYESEGIDDEAFENEGVWLATVTRWFNIINTTEDRFIEMVRELNYSRFEN